MSNAEQMYTCQAMQSLFSKLCWRLNKVYDSFAKAMHRTIPFMNFEIRHHVISLVGLYDGHLNCFLRLVEIEELSFRYDHSYECISFAMRFCSIRKGNGKEWNFTYLHNNQKCKCFTAVF